MLCNARQNLTGRIVNTACRMQKERESHCSSHIRLIGWTQPVSRDIRQHSKQRSILIVRSVRVEHNPVGRVTGSCQEVQENLAEGHTEICAASLWDGEVQGTMFCTRKESQQSSMENQTSLSS